MEVLLSWTRCKVFVPLSILWLIIVDTILSVSKINKIQ